VFLDIRMALGGARRSARRGSVGDWREEAEMAGAVLSTTGRRGQKKRGNFLFESLATH
jgi:hypothetical protein